MDRHIQQPTAQEQAGCEIGHGAHARKVPRPLSYPCTTSYGRTSELLTTGGCIADVSDERHVPGDGSHTRVGSLRDPIVPRRSARPGINLSLPWAGSQAALGHFVRGTYVGCGTSAVDDQTTRQMGKVRKGRRSQSYGRPRGRRGRHRCLKGGNLERRRATCQYMPVTRPARCRPTDAYTQTQRTWKHTTHRHRHKAQAQAQTQAQFVADGVDGVDVCVYTCVCVGVGVSTHVCGHMPMSMSMLQKSTSLHLSNGDRPLKIGTCPRHVAVMINYARRTRPRARSRARLLTCIAPPSIPCPIRPRTGPRQAPAACAMGALQPRIFNGVSGVHLWRPYRSRRRLHHLHKKAACLIFGVNTFRGSGASFCGGQRVSVHLFLLAARGCGYSMMHTHTHHTTHTRT